MTYTAGQKVRASQMPGYVCTSSTRPVGHSGQIIYETDTGMTAIYAGGAWRYLAPTGEIGSDAEYNANATQTISNITDTLVAFGTTNVSSPLVVRNVSGVGHYFRLQRAGRWAVTSTIRWGSVAQSGERYMAIRKAGSPIVSQGTLATAGTAPITMACAIVTRVANGSENTAAADIDVIVFQGSGSSKGLEFNNGSAWGRVNLSWLGP